MANYGELIDSNIDIHRMPIYTYFLEYFGDPRLALFKETPEGHVIYGAKVRSQLSRQKRYLFVHIKKDYRDRSGFQYPKEINLKDIQWSCLQTRVLDEDYNLPSFTYAGKQSNEHIIKLVKKDDSRYTYTCESFPGSSIVLLVTKTQMKPYNQTGTLSLAIETFNCLIYV